MRILFTLFICLAMPGLLFGQRRSGTEAGEMVEGEFVINKELEITLPPAQRIFEKVPPDELAKRDLEPVEYTFKDYNPRLPDINTRLRVLKLKDPETTSNLSSYINFGFGNYFTPLVQAGFNTGPSKTSNYGLSFHHLSSTNGPVDKNNSGDSHSNLNLYGKSIGKTVAIDGEVEYSRNRYHFYGYDDGIEVARDTIEQMFNNYGINLNLANSKAGSDLQYRVFTRFNNMTDDFDARELGLRGGFKSDYTLNEISRARLDLDFLVTSYKNPDQINRSLIRVSPSFVYNVGDFTIDAGVRVVNQNDTLNNEKQTRLFPAITVMYDLSLKIAAYAGLNGDVDEVTFERITNENPFVNSHLPLAHSIRNFDLSVGLRGSLVEGLGFDVGARSAIFSNMYFYVNDPDEFNKFNVVYDQGNTALFQIYASMSYLKGKNLGSNLGARLNGWSPGKVDKAWHRPAVEFNYSLWYNFFDKVRLYTDLFAITGIKALDSRTEPDTTVSLPGAVDLSLKLEYLLSEKYGFFVNLNNLFNNNYQLYYRYPTRGLLAIAGLKISL